MRGGRGENSDYGGGVSLSLTLVPILSTCSKVYLLKVCLLLQLCHRSEKEGSLAYSQHTDGIIGYKLSPYKGQSDLRTALGSYGKVR